jgi:hypothetical protein
VAYVGPLRRALYERVPTLVLNRPERLEDVASDDRAFFLWFSTALIGLGTVTLVLALVGVYAVMAIIVTRRTREIGIRVTLGATSRRIIGTIVGRAAWQVGLGGALAAACDASCRGRPRDRGRAPGPGGAAPLGAFFRAFVSLSVDE